MFCIDYTAPDGTTHRIETPILTYVCPTCGKITMFRFGDNFIEDLCPPCNERQPVEEKAGLFKR